MIASLKGKVAQLLPTSTIVEVADIGYEVFFVAKARESLQLGQVITCYIAENIKEDEHTLYGFTDLDSRGMYYQLTSVNGVGPKAAMAILSDYTTPELEQAILKGESSLFSSVSGIGGKTASRIILELKGKLVEPETKANFDTKDPAYQALLSLGYKPHDAKAALQSISKDLSTQERIVMALKVHK